MPSQHFSVTFPLKGSLTFVNALKGKKATIFIEQLGIKQISFHSNLALPSKINNEPVEYLLSVPFLGDDFKLSGFISEHVQRGLLAEYTLKLNINDEDASNLFKILNKYSILLNRVETYKDSVLGPYRKKQKEFSASV